MYSFTRAKPEGCFNPDYDLHFLHLPRTVPRRIEIRSVSTCEKVRRFIDRSYRAASDKDLIFVGFRVVTGNAYRVVKIVGINR